MRSITINFRDGTKKQWPDPNSRVINARGYRVTYGDGFVTVTNNGLGYSYSFPMDTVKSVEEEPEPRW